MFINHDTKIFLRALVSDGYLFLARDRDDNSLYAYKQRPEQDLNDGIYVIPDDADGYSCLCVNRAGCEMFILDRDNPELDKLDLTHIQVPCVRFESGVIEINTILADTDI